MITSRFFVMKHVAHVVNIPLLIGSMLDKEGVTKFQVQVYDVIKIARKSN